MKRWIQAIIDALNDILIFLRDGVQFLIAQILAGIVAIIEGWWRMCFIWVQEVMDFFLNTLQALAPVGGINWPEGYEIACYWVPFDLILPEIVAWSPVIGFLICLRWILRFIPTI